METISKEYLLMQQELHLNTSYGVASVVFAPLVSEIITAYESKSLCDYGAGKKRLAEALKDLNNLPELYFPYDPIFPEYGEPKKADLVSCIDVLEHIEPDFIDNVITELSSITTKHCFCTVNRAPAQKILSDGRNAHLIQESTSWWLEKFVKHFEVIQVTQMKDSHGFWLLLKPKDLYVKEKELHLKVT